MTRSRNELRNAKSLLRLPLCLLWLAICFPFASAQTSAPWLGADDVYWSSKFGLPGIDQAGVRTIAATATDIYVGGDFTMAGGVRVNGIARLDKATGNWHALGGGVQGIVTAICVSGQDVFVAGTFFSAGGNPARGIARWNGSAWSALLHNGNTLTPQGTISAITVVGDHVYVGGAFTLRVVTTDLRGIACWNRKTETWSSLDGGLSNPVGALRVSSLLVRDRAVYVGGEFSRAGSAAIVANNIAVWDDSLSIWSVLGTANDNGVQGPVTVLASDGDDLIVGGRFLFTATATARNIARWNAAQRQWSAFGSGLREIPSAIVPTGSEIFVAITENTPGGTPVWGVVAWSGSAWAAPQYANNAVNALLATGDTLLAGGDFTEIGATRSRYLTRWNGSTWTGFATPLSAGRSATVSAIAISGDDVYVGGTFSTIDGYPMNNIARWNRTSSTWSSLGTDSTNGVNGDVYAIRVLGDRVYVGGFFGVAGNVSAGNVAAFSLSQQRWEALAEASDPAREGTDGAVLSLAVDSVTGSLYAGGAFTIAGADTVLGMAQWKNTTKEWVKLDAALDVAYSFATIDAMDFANGMLFAGGSFQPKVSLSKTMVLRCGRDGVWYSIADNVDGNVSAIRAISDSSILIGGEFTVFGNGTGISNLARWDRSRVAIDNLGGGVDGPVRALAKEGSSVFVGGLFSTAGGVPAESIARWDGVRWRALGSGSDAAVNVISTFGNRVLAGGDFLSAGAKPAYHFSEFDNSVLEADDVDVAPEEIAVSLFPSPVRNTATIHIRLRNTEEMTIRIYDALGRLVAAPYHGVTSAGVHALRWDATALPSGVYRMSVVTATGACSKEITIAH